jgi:hypothetical protein
MDLLDFFIMYVLYRIGYVVFCNTPVVSKFKPRYAISADLCKNV